MEHDVQQDPARQHERPDDDAIRALVARLARPHRSGGQVIERASLLSAGADFDALMAWIEEHGGEAETVASPRAQRGLHSARPVAHAAAGPTPLRFILPAAALRETAPADHRGQETA